jgi:hypothetical protein
MLATRIDEEQRDVFLDEACIEKFLRRFFRGWESREACCDDE